MAKDLPVTLGEVSSTFILYDESISAPHGCERIAQRRSGLHLQFVVRSLPENSRQRSLGILRPIDIGIEAHPIAHGNHDGIVRDGVVLELSDDGLRLIVPVVLAAARGRLLCEYGGGG